MVIKRTIKLIRKQASGSDGRHWGTVQRKTWYFIFIPIITIETLV